MIGQHDGDRPAIDGQSRAIPQGREQRVLLPRMVEVVGVEPEEAHERGGVRCVAVVGGDRRVCQQRAGHTFDQVVFGPQFVQ